MPLLSAAAPSSLIASTALPTPLPTILAVPTAASAASPTAEAVTLTAVAVTATTVQPDSRAPAHRQRKAPRAGDREGLREDRKSTRLNSSHLVISYAVFCLKTQKTDTAT